MKAKYWIHFFLGFGIIIGIIMGSIQGVTEGQMVSESIPIEPAQSNNLESLLKPLIAPQINAIYPDQLCNHIKFLEGEL